MQELPLWPVTICGDAARRAVTRIGGITEQNPLLPGEVPSKNPLPSGEGRVRVVPQSSYRAAFVQPNPVPKAEGGPRRAPGKIIAVFARSFYVANDADELLCIGPSNLGGGPLNMLCELPADLDFQASGLRVGEAASYDGATLRVAERFAFTLADATPWLPKCPSEGWDRATLASGLAALSAVTGGLAGADGFAPLVAPLASGHAGVTAPASALLRLAVPGITALAEWLDRGGAAMPDEVAQTLLGLGPGLTPSGDDFIGGVLVALHVLGCRATAARLADWALPLARMHTGAISVAHLACAAAGEGCAALHDVLVALVMPNADGLREALASLTAIGHSSGWDMLAGAALAGAAVRDGLSA